MWQSMATTVANLIQQLEDSYYRSWVAETSYYDGGWLVRKTPDSPFKRLNNVTPLNMADDHDIEQRVLAHCGSHLEKPLAMRLIPLSAPKILNYVERHQWKALASVGVYVLDLKGRDVLAACDNCPIADLNLFAESVTIGDTSIELIDPQLYAEISIAHHQAKPSEVKPLNQLVQRCEAKPYPLIFKINGKIFANIFLVEDNGMIGMFDFALAPNMRGQGLGRQSFNAVLEYLRLLDAIRFVWLQIESTNATALHLYQSFSFKKIYAYDYYVVD